MNTARRGITKGIIFPALKNLYEMDNTFPELEAN